MNGSTEEVVIHRFLWMKDVPQIDDLDTQNPINLQRFVDFWNKYVPKWHPNVNAPPAAVHLSAQLFATKLELAEMLNQFQWQRHCQSGYCERQNKTTGERFCQFGFPKKCREQSEFARDANRDFAEFHSK